MVRIAFTRSDMVSQSRADRAPVNDSWGFVKDITSAEVVVRHTAFDKSYTLARRSHDLDFGQQMDRALLHSRYPLHFLVGIRPGVRTRG